MPVRYFKLVKMNGCIYNWADYMPGEVGRVIDKGGELRVEWLLPRESPHFLPKHLLKGIDDTLLQITEAEALAELL